MLQQDAGNSAHLSSAKHLPAMHLGRAILKRGCTDLLLTQAVDIIASGNGHAVKPPSQSHRDSLDRLEFASDDDKGSSEEYDTDLETTGKKHLILVNFVSIITDKYVAASICY
jgi:hypothetical protein